MQSACLARTCRLIPICVVAVTGMVIGCAGPGPQMSLGDPIEFRKLANGSVQRWYAVGSPDGRDYVEQLSPEGRIVAIGYAQADGQDVDMIHLDEIPPTQREDLVLLLDSVPYSLVADYWAAGKFRLFHTPTRTIAPFPVMTDVSFAEFFNCSPIPAAEAQSYNGLMLTYGYGVYTVSGDAQWMRYLNWHLPIPLHPQAYMNPYPWLDHELRMFQETYLRHRRPTTVCYSIATSCVGAKYDGQGMETALNQVDRFTRDLVYRTRGRVRITMLSDHGLAFVPGGGQRIKLRDEYRRLGHPSVITLCGKQDVVVPEFGLVSCASVYTHSAADVARDSVNIDGVELSAYMEGDELVVYSVAGRARIRCRNERFSYTAERGDPLELEPLLARLAEKGQVTADGFVDDGILFEATADSTYPDAVARLWRAFHGLLQRTPQVYISEADGYYSGDSTMNAYITIVGIHGNLRQASSTGFAMTMAGELPRVHRQIDLRRELMQLGVCVPGDSSASR